MINRVRRTGWVRLGVMLVAGVLAAGLWLLPSFSDAQNTGQFFASTGHSITDEYGFLTYWETHSGAALLGDPVTAVVQEDDRPVQYFERGRLEYHADLPANPVLLGRIGADYAAALWAQFAAPSGDTATGLLFEQTGHTLAAPFLAAWYAHGSVAHLGYPISEPFWETIGNEEVQVQYFERGRLEYRPSLLGQADAIRMGNLGAMVAQLRGHSLAAGTAASSEDAATLAAQVAQPVATLDDAGGPVLLPEPAPLPEVYTPPADAAAPVQPAAPAPEPEPVYVEPEPVYVEPEPVYVEPAPASSGGKSIQVSIGAQWLYAYEGGVLVFDAPVTTGRDGFNTPVGDYSVYAKIPVQTMSGTLGGEYYNVPDVPNVMYINGGVALHGTYWHNWFGSGVRVSHGCINLPLDSAAWLYNWAPMGTPVSVTW